MLPMVDRMVWKLFSLIIAFSLVIGSSNGATSDNLQKLTVANNDLGLRLYQILAKNTSGNLFFSPFSLSNAFAMLFAGANGNTEKQLRFALGYDAANIRSSNVPSAFNKYLGIVLPKNQSPTPEYILNLANELLLTNDFIVYPEYKKQVQNLFLAYIKEVDFIRNSAQIVEEVNNWVNEQTHGKISQFLCDLSPSTVLLILNAIYFKGTWKTPFDKEMTKHDNFYNDGSSSKAKDVPLMHLTSKFPYAEVGDLQALELPYKGDNVSMIVLLPQKRDGLSIIESSITPQKLQDIQKQMFTTEVTVTFPKFKIDYKRRMNSDFKVLGARDMFNPGLADFSDITPNNGVHVSEIIHKAAVEVNEEGVEAAAATAIHLMFLSASANPPPPPKFTADHPFMFAIINKGNDLILFLGRVVEFV